MKKLLLLFFLCVFNFCYSQENNKSLLLSRIESENLIDSIKHPAIVKVVNEKRQWTKNFEYIDSLSVSKIRYLSDNLKVNGYIVQPKKKGQYPCVIWNRGGVKEYGALNMIRVLAMLGKLAKEGFVVIATQYRGNGGSEGQEEYGGAEINDVLNLIKVLEDIPNADTSKIGMFGGSRGGMMTYIALKPIKSKQQQYWLLHQMSAKV